MTASLCIHDIDPSVRVVELTDMPKPDAGAPVPTITGDEHCIVVGYYTSSGQWAIVRFDSVSTHAFGSPNDEAIHGHPLFEYGLKPYDCYEVKPSPWLNQLEIANRVHSRHDPKWFMSGEHHYIIAFHDTLFECIAERYESSVIDPEKHKPLDEMIRVWKQPAKR